MSRSGCPRGLFDLDFSHFAVFQNAQFEERNPLSTCFPRRLRIERLDLITAQRPGKTGDSVSRAHPPPPEPSPLAPLPRPELPCPPPPPSKLIPPTTSTSPLPKRLPAPAAFPSASPGLLPGFQPPFTEPGPGGREASCGKGAIIFSGSLVSSLVFPTAAGVSMISGLDRSLGSFIFGVFSLGRVGGRETTLGFSTCSKRDISTSSTGTSRGWEYLLLSPRQRTGIKMR